MPARVSTRPNYWKSHFFDELGLDIVDEQIIRDEYLCPYHGFLETDDATRVADPGDESEP